VACGEPVWHIAERFFLGQAPTQIRNWLIDRASLTRRLQATANSSFAVCVLAQKWRKPLLSEAKALDVPADRFVFVRHVLLLVDGRPRVFARTVIPSHVARGRLRGLTRLGSRPLGEILFSTPRMRRGEIEIACLTHGHTLYRQSLLDTPGVSGEPIWGRRSVFYLYNCPLLVNEFFLPPYEALGFK
jgi:chorismate--pyruvate lyase